MLSDSDTFGSSPQHLDEEFADRRRKLIESVPRDQREWLHQKLGENKPSLRQRLLDLAQLPYAASMSEMLPNPGAWAKATRDERNAVAHGGKNMSRDVPLLVAIVTTTTAVVVLNLLHQLDIPAERIKMGLDYNRTLESAKYLVNKQWPASENADKS